MKVGGAKVSDKHCNFIINEWKATASDIIQLISLVQEKVFLKTGVLLEPEVKILGEIWNKNNIKPLYIYQIF